MENRIGQKLYIKNSCFIYLPNSYENYSEDQKSSTPFSIIGQNVLYDKYLCYMPQDGWILNHKLDLVKSLEIGISNGFILNNVKVWWFRYEWVRHYEI
jgi:hypothetical protein